MNAKFYFNNSDRRVLEKTLTIVANNVTVRYKEDTELIRPVLICDSDKFSSDINYVYVGGAIKRYYYIEDVTMSQGKVELHCAVDVLMSFKEQILETEVICARNTNYWNMYLNDDRMELENRERILTKPFSKGFRDYYNSSKPASFILVMSGSGNAPTPPPESEE